MSLNAFSIFYFLVGFFVVTLALFVDERTPGLYGLAGIVCIAFGGLAYAIKNEFDKRLK